MNQPPENEIIENDAFSIVPGLPDNSIDCVITDPPYPNRMGLFRNDLCDGLALLYYVTRKVKGSIVFFWNPFNVPSPPPGWYETARHVWSKPDAKSNTRWEAIVVWTRDYKRTTSKVWHVPILDYRSLYDWKPHPTQKPVRLLRYLVELYTDPGALVLDPFVGSGTTAVACQTLGRRYLGIENNPDYATMARDRLTKKKPTEAGERQATLDSTETEEPVLLMDVIHPDPDDHLPDDPPTDEDDDPDEQPDEPATPARPPPIRNHGAKTKKPSRR